MTDSRREVLTPADSRSTAQDDESPVIQYTVAGGCVGPNSNYAVPRILGRTTQDVDAPGAVSERFDLCRMTRMEGQWRTDPGFMILL